ncbi:MAG: hypothetical protein JWM77_3811 [Rhodospirillales bacterium]|nr:hypothetical protein [Rhodospirillales bacterium]
MTEEQVDQTISRLVADIRPVRRIAPPMRRFLLWTAAALAVLGTLIWRLGAMPRLAREFDQAVTGIELVAAFLTGVLALFAAFHLIMPDRSPRWAWLPMPTLAVWLGATLFACVDTGLEYGPAALFQGIGWFCFIFIAVVSLPLGLALLLALRRGAPVAPIRAAMLGGLGVSALAATALHAFHPFDGGIGDTGMHALAVVAIVAAFGALARPTLDRM